jgi:hypothetical protein
MRYLDLLQLSNYENEDCYKGSKDRFSRYDHVKGGYERTKKGCRVTWLSPIYGTCSGRLLIAPVDGWVLVQGEHTPDLLVWVREDLLHATR